MAAQHPSRLTSDDFTASRRAFLSALALSPAVAPVIRNEVIGSLGHEAQPLSILPPTDDPLALRRSGSGRDLSRFRYHNAECFFASIEGGIIRHGSDLLYHTGIVIQLGLSSHLLDVGFDDGWCARHLGLYVAKSLACANATGLDHRVPGMDHLADILSPYSLWRYPDWYGDRPVCTYSPADICKLTRALLDRVGDTTGHRRSSDGVIESHD